MLFKLGLFLIPFENFFFAPSTGWAAIAPFIFFLYFLTKLKLIFLLVKKEKKIIMFIIFMIFWGGLIAILDGKINIYTIKRTIYTLILGLTFYFSLIIRYKIEKKDIRSDLQTLLNGYLFSILIGIVQWISYSYNLSSVIRIFQIFSKRLYIGRVQFTMTEPSFISMHIYGIILILYTFLKKIKISPTKLHRNILIAFPLLVLVIGKSTRFILDTFIILSIFFICKFFSMNLKKVTKLLYIVIMISVIILLFDNKNIIMEKIGKYNSRVEKIYTKGIYADGSLASRYFRVNASIKGYQKDFFRTFRGYGIGNISIPFLKGYQEAKKEYKSSYITEVEALKEFKGYSLYCMHIKLISEYGLIFFIIILINLYSTRYIFEYFVLCYLFLQFDSYAFYLIWLYLFIKNKKYMKSSKLKYRI